MRSLSVLPRSPSSHSFSSLLVHAHAFLSQACGMRHWSCTPLRHELPYSSSSWRGDRHDGGAQPPDSEADRLRHVAVESTVHHPHARRHDERSLTSWPAKQRCSSVMRSILSSTPLSSMSCARATLMYVRDPGNRLKMAYAKMVLLSRPLSLECLRQG